MGQLVMFPPVERRFPEAEQVVAALGKETDSLFPRRGAIKVDQIIVPSHEKPGENAHIKIGAGGRVDMRSASELVAHKPSKAPFDPSEQVGARVCMKAREFGLLIRPLGDVLVVMPPLSISVEQLDWMTDVMIRCTRIVTEGSNSD